MNAFLALTLLSSVSLAQVGPTPSASTPEAITPSTTDAPKEACLKALTPAEQTEFLTARQKALMDPSVQSTREIARMALHKAMLQTDPSIETIIANMNAAGSGSTTQRHHKSLGGNFDHWLANFPAASVVTLSPEEKEKLSSAHRKALLDPAVKEARKEAHVTFYNAMINADPLIAPLLTKAGISTPSTAQPLSKKEHLGSEEKILGGDFQEWGEEMLAPAIKNQEKMATPKSGSSSGSSDQ